MAATIKDIAKELGISISTVSYALNGGPRPVPHDVRERVLAKAREIDYRPNRLARSLVTGRANAIGIAPPATHRDLFRSPFIQVAFNAIVNEAEVHGQDLVLFTAQNRDLMRAGADLMDARIDAVVFIAPTVEATAIRELDERHFPYAIIAGSDSAGSHSFSADNELGVRQAVESLVRLGHRRIAHVAGTEDHVDAIQRRGAFLALVEEFGLDWRPEYLIPGEFNQISGYRAAQLIGAMSVPPTAVVAANDEIAFGFTVGARDVGLRIPDRVSLIGFDDSAFCPTLSPPLTSIRQPIDDMVAAAMRYLMDRLEGGPIQRAQKFPTELIVRGSTAPPG